MRYPRMQALNRKLLGYTLKEVGNYSEKYYSTISWIVKENE